MLAGSRSGEPGTDPALVAAEHPLPAEVYWRAVREVVPVAEVRTLLARTGAWWRASRDDRGLVGAAAAVAWPGHHPTWELTAYREPARQGAPRLVERASVLRAVERFPSLFLCHDPRTRRLLVAPHTACPVLFGLRSSRRTPLFAARREIRSEPVDRWVLFRTNQGSGDHLVARTARDMTAYRAGRLRATVSAPPTVLVGGHVRLDAVDADGAPFVCIAFEPTKTLPRVARALTIGDRVEVWGSRHDDPVVRLEGIRVLRLTARHGRRRPPSCPSCHRTTHSLGSSRGYRCPACRRRLPPEAGERSPVTRPALLGVHHPTPSARRHLAPRAPEV